MAKARSMKETVSAARASVTSSHAGPNVKAQAGWRQRVMAALPEDFTYRELSERSITQDGRNLAHTTIRAIMLGNGSINVDTLAAICDGLKIDLAYVISGKNNYAALPPPGGAVGPGTSVTALPIVDMRDAAKWGEIAKDPKLQTDLCFIETSRAKNIMVARVTDDAMAPDYLPGDIVTFRMGDPPSTKVPAIVRVEPSSETFMRTIYKSGERVRLEAANKDYGTTTVSPKKIDFVAHVVGHIRGIG